MVGVPALVQAASINPPAGVPSSPLPLNGIAKPTVSLKSTPTESIPEVAVQNSPKSNPT